MNSIPLSITCEQVVTSFTSFAATLSDKDVLLNLLRKPKRFIVADNSRTLELLECTRTVRN
jgi:hypothetical protein